MANIEDRKIELLRRIELVSVSLYQASCNKDLRALERYSKKLNELNDELADIEELAIDYE